MPFTFCYSNENYNENVCFLKISLRFMKDIMRISNQSETVSLAKSSVVFYSKSLCKTEFNKILMFIRVIIKKLIVFCLCLKCNYWS